MVGAGFSGTLAAIHLLRHGHPATVVRLIEQSGDFGPGRAYATRDPTHLLNVPAGRMGAFPGQPGHFLDWLRAQPGQGGAGEGDFVSRRLYGAYLRRLLDEAAATAGPRLERIRAQVTSVTEAASLTLVLAHPAPADAAAPHPRSHPVRPGGDIPATLQADAAILATGNFPPLPPPGIDPACLPPGAYAHDPWCPSALDRLPLDAAVILLGSGLTMADAVLSLLGAGHRGLIHVLSRHGLVPRSHATAPAPPVCPVLPSGLVPLLRSTRRAIRDGAPWQAVVDGLRPCMAELWRDAPDADRRRFLRHLRAWWDVHRHRLPPATAACIEAARSSGQLRLHAGRITGAAAIPDGTVRLAFHPRAARATATLEAARIINCTGPAPDYARIPDPLARSLLASGTVRPDPLHLGLDTTASLALRRADGTPSTRIFALGPVLRATFWEMTSVPDLRLEAERLALHLAGQPRPAGEVRR